MCRRKKAFDQFERKKEITNRLTDLTVNWAPAFASESPESAVHAEELRAALSDACTALKKIVLPRRDEKKIALYAESILFEIGILEAAALRSPEEREGFVPRDPEYFGDSSTSEERIDDAVRKIEDTASLWAQER